MWEYTLKDLERYQNILPKADYDCLEKFLRTISDDQLYNIRIALHEIQKGNSTPLDQVIILNIIGNIFLREYEQKVFKRSNYIDLLPIFATSVFYECLYRFKPDAIERVNIWRELVPSQIEKYKNQHNNLKKSEND